MPSRISRRVTLRRSRSETLVVLTTCPDMATAERIAEMVIRDRVAACANIVPGVASLFHWQGKLDRSKEVLLILKTTVQAFDRLSQCIRLLHPYQVPEIIGLPVIVGFQPYLGWIQETVTYPAS